MMLMWFATAGIVLLVVVLLLGLYATLLEPYRPVLRRIAIPVPATWPQLAILHLSDLHVSTGSDRLYRAQERFLRSVSGTPDLVCVTGDVCEQLVDAPRVAALLRLVAPRVATLVVLGNHEHDAPMPESLRRTTRVGWGWLMRLAQRTVGARARSSGAAEGHAIGDALSAAGVRVLRNEGVRLELDGRSLWVAGMESVWAGCAQAAPALRGHYDGEPCLGLVHEPEGAPALMARGAALALAGHTHGGQVSLPWVGAPYSLQSDPRIRITAGAQPLGRGLLLISAGLGHTIPLRFNCPPEATWIECVPTTPSPAATHERERLLAAASERGS